MVIKPFCSVMQANKRIKVLANSYLRSDNGVCFITAMWLDIFLTWII